jgi:hypothetical protein
MANSCEDKALSADGTGTNDRNQSGKAYSIGCFVLRLAAKLGK